MPGGTGGQRCPWRTILKDRDVYSDELSVQDIFTSLNEFMAPNSTSSEQLETWTESQAEHILSVINRVRSVSLSVFFTKA
jgi:hypothetical protein